MKIIPAIVLCVVVIFTMYIHFTNEIARLEVENVGLQSRIGMQSMDLDILFKNIKILDERIPQYISMDAQGKVYCSCINNKIKEK